MMIDYTDSPLKQGHSAETAGPPSTPGPVPTRRYDSPSRMLPHLPGGGSDTSNQQPTGGSTLTSQFPWFPTQQLQFHTPVWHPTGTGLGVQLASSPPILSPYADPHAPFTLSAHTSNPCNLKCNSSCPPDNGAGPHGPCPPVPV